MLQTIAGIAVIVDVANVIDIIDVIDGDRFILKMLLKIIKVWLSLLKKLKMLIPIVEQKLMLPALLTSLAFKKILIGLNWTWDMLTIKLTYLQANLVTNVNSNVATQPKLWL